MTRAWSIVRCGRGDILDPWRVEPEDAAALLRGGLRPEPAGLELHPPRHLYFVSREELAGLVSAREIPVRLGAELLEAEHVAVLRFP